MINSNATILRWNDSLNKIAYYRSFNWGDIDAIPVSVNFVPPFQLARAKTGAAITLFKLVNFNTGVETIVTSEMATIGLRVAQYASKDYDNIIFPALSALPIAALPVGPYYAVMSDGANTWYSEIFSMCASLAGTVKIEWCHAGDFGYPGGHLDYSQNYKNYVHLKTDIGAPTYPYFEEGEDRDGVFFPHKQISYKLWRFGFLASESMLDAIRLIRLHDTVTIVNNNDGRTYSASEFLFGSPEWMEGRKNLGYVEAEFRTDTIVVINGRAVLDDTCGPEQPCFAFTFECVAQIEDGSAEYLGQYYVPAGGGPNVPFVEGDYILIYNDGLGVWELHQFISSAYVAVTGTAENTIALDQNENRYYWQNVNPTGNNWLRPWISAIINKDKTGAVTSNPRLWTVYGQVMPGTTIEVFTVNEAGEETLAGVGSDVDFQGLGIEFIWTEQAISARIKVSSALCNRFETSDDFDFEGVNYWDVEGDFEVQ